MNVNERQVEFDKWFSEYAPEVNQGANDEDNALDRFFYDFALKGWMAAHAFRDAQEAMPAATPKPEKE